PHARRRPLERARGRLFPLGRPPRWDRCRRSAAALDRGRRHLRQGRRLLPRWGRRAVGRPAGIQLRDPGADRGGSRDCRQAAGAVSTSVLILGAGFGGLELATRLSESVADDVDVTLIDRNDAFYFGYSKLDVLLGRKTAEEILLPYADI